MSVTFGPQLIGETEKTLNALLRKALHGTGLSEPEWVTLRVAGQNQAGVDLAGLVADRAHFPDAADLVVTLTARELLQDQGLSARGQELVAEVRRRIAEATGSLWDDLAPGDVAATERILNTVVSRGRALLD